MVSTGSPRPPPLPPYEVREMDLSWLLIDMGAVRGVLLSGRPASVRYDGEITGLRSVIEGVRKLSIDDRERGRGLRAESMNSSDDESLTGGEGGKENVIITAIDEVREVGGSFFSRVYKP
jgi:hypothetical protein